MVKQICYDQVNGIGLVKDRGKNLNWPKIELAVNLMSIKSMPNF